jgi:hypothetical protein
MDADSELVPRTILIDEFGISDSCERRRRKEGADWPPHLLIGKKVYYRRESLDDWLRHREAATQSVPREPVDDNADAEVMTAILRRAKVLADAAPPLTSQQVLLLRSIFANRAGGVRA